jgi:peroxiredoxin
MLELIKREDAQTAPDFEVMDSAGETANLASYGGKSNVVLVLNRGFS